MKLFIVAALISVAAAARLEHLERGYLPPNHSHGQAGFDAQGSQFGSQGSFGSGSQGSFGSSSQGSFGSGSQGSFGSFDSNAVDSAGAGARSQGFGSAFPSATSNQYLPPNHGPSGSNGQFSGSLSGFQHSQYNGGASQYTPNQFGSASNGFAQPRYQQQNSNQGSQLRQYLAPKPSSSYPQQAFDEQTGYHY